MVVLEQLYRCAVGDHRTSNNEANERLRVITTLGELERLTKMVNDGEMPRAARLWRGADVVITPEELEHETWWSDPIQVVTPHALEVSWVFEILRNAFCAEERIDGCSKIEFFGRLATAANRRLLRESDASAPRLCEAVVRAALAIYREMEEGDFDELKKLDRVEGHPKAYERRLRTVTTSDDVTLEAWVYTVAEPREEAPPNRAYWRLLVDGAKQAGIPADYVAEELERLAHL